MSAPPPSPGPARSSRFDPATLNRAAHVIHAVTPRLPADAALRQELAANTGLSRTARSAVSRAVFTYYRWLQWLNPKDSLQRQIDEAVQRQRRFDHDPSSTKPEALAARAVPAWISAEAEIPNETLQLWQSDPVLWLRARPGTSSRLASELGSCSPAKVPATARGTLPLLRDALRYEGTSDLFQSAAFHRGAFEIQDLASQYAALACSAQPGETWWDACAGEGGKTLSLADTMQNKGLIWASDRSQRRLEQLRLRFGRAQLFNVRIASWDGSDRLPTKGRFDGILLDAPCSGVGTWGRNPHARWTASPEDVDELAAIQRRLLFAVAPALKPGGRLVYAVCTLTGSETTAVVESFNAEHPEFVLVDVFGQSRSGRNPPSTPAGSPSSTSPVESREIPNPAPTGTPLFLWPHEIEAHGMFIAAWRRR